MIADMFVDLYARNSGLRDKLVAERDVVLTYALRAIIDSGVMDHLAFKGGTCLRKLIFGSAGRFSELCPVRDYAELACVHDRQSGGSAWNGSA